jgi:hypothetical protein
MIPISFHSVVVELVIRVLLPTKTVSVTNSIHLLNLKSLALLIGTLFVACSLSNAQKLKKSVEMSVKIRAIGAADYVWGQPVIVCKRPLYFGFSFSQLSLRNPPFMLNESNTLLVAVNGS